jgi:hypothetical protein
LGTTGAGAIQADDEQRSFVAPGHQSSGHGVAKRDGIWSGPSLDAQAATDEECGESAPLGGAIDDERQ